MCLERKMTMCQHTCQHTSTNGMYVNNVHLCVLSSFTFTQLYTLFKDCGYRRVQLYTIFAGCE
jgi:hypothetical protein